MLPRELSCHQNHINKRIILPGKYQYHHYLSQFTLKEEKHITLDLRAKLD